MVGDASHEIQELEPDVTSDLISLFLRTVLVLRPRFRSLFRRSKSKRRGSLQCSVDDIDDEIHVSSNFAFIVSTVPKVVTVRGRASLGMTAMLKMVLPAPTPQRHGQ